MKGKKSNFYFAAICKGSFFVIYILLVNLLLISCKKQETVLRVAVSYMNENFDPIKVYDEYFCHIKRNVFETLLDIENGNPVPLLADNWIWYGDSLLVVNIKENVRFSNNVLMISDDIYKSFERALNHPLSVLNIYKPFIDSLYVQNNQLYLYYNTIDVVFELLSKVPIYSSSVITFFDDTTISEYPLSTGRYFLYSRAQEKIVLRKNLYHRDHSKHCVYFDVVEIYYEPDIEKQYQMLLNNEIDFIFQLPISSYNEVFRNPDLVITEVESNSMLLMMLDSESTNLFNENNRQENLSANPLRDRRVRRAIAHSLDTESFIQNVLAGRANLLSIPCFLSIQGYPLNTKYYEYDVSLSKDLLKQAGFENGFEMRIKAFESMYTDAIAEFIEKSLKDINIDVVMEIVPHPASKTDISMNTSLKPSFSLSSMEGVSALIVKKETRANASIEDILGDILYFPQTDKRGTYNIMNYANPAIVSLLDSLYTMRFYDLARINISETLADLVYEEVYVIPFFQPIELFVSNKRVSFQYNENFRFTDFCLR
ncbi:MAG: ABC transporter substrate-binding protein [Candidatus Cloacimonetes bacterium]|nr:ABC transporter substrate-binding protein [Candidatus Cloacimonadota bacterium]